ncbi:MAG: hypothetical protein ACREK8_09920 [Gemmatimonadales bacterium]
MARFAQVMFLLALAWTRGSAQSWQSGSALELIRRAVVHRSARDADTLLTGWQAEAHGILRFVSELDHGDSPVERVIRLDELRVEVYGQAPNRSKQIITAWRDTTFLPNQLAYHRDHLGIVANDFGPAIRLGQGDEVRDVPHPISEAGLSTYQFAIGDTLVLSTASGRVRVAAIRVRPIHPDSAGTVGTLYLDLDRAALVRFAFTFTPASYRDPTVESITVTLDNALQRNARWLPWRQSIVIRRGVPLLDFPLRTVIRADWTLDNYQLGLHLPAEFFTGPFIVGPGAPNRVGAWDAPIAASLEGLPATGADVAMVQQDAARYLGGHLLDGLPRVRFLADGVSQLLTVNRVEGVTPALGARFAVDGSILIRVRGGYGLSDHRIIGELGVAGRRRRWDWSLGAERLVRDVADIPVISGVANSLGTAISGDDHGDYTLLDRATAGLGLDAGATHLGLELSRESSRSVASTFTPWFGEIAANPALGVGAATVLRATASRSGSLGAKWSLDAEVGTGTVSWSRFHGAGQARIAMPRGELQFSAEAGIGSVDLPGYRSFVLGGRGTLLGVPFRSMGGRRSAWAEVAWSIPVAAPTPPVPGARYAKLPSTIAPFVAAGIAGGDEPGLPWRATGRIEPSAGLRLDLWGPLIRLEAGMAVRTGRAAIVLDIHPDWWRLM